MNLIQLIEKNPVVVINLETTGLNYACDTIVDIGAVKIGGWNKIAGSNENDIITDGKIVGYYSPFLIPTAKSPNELTDSNKKTPICIASALQQLKRFTDNSIIVAYNLEFHYNFLRHYGNKYRISFDNRRIDILSVAKTIFRDKIKDYTLSFLTKKFNIEYHSQQALSVAVAAARLFLELAQRDDESHCNY